MKDQNIQLQANAEAVQLFLWSFLYMCAVFFSYLFLLYCVTKYQMRYYYGQYSFMHWVWYLDNLINVKECCHDVIEEKNI